MVGTLYRPLLLGAVISIAFAAGCADASPPPNFKCEPSKHPQLQREGYRLGGFIYDIGDSVGLTGYPAGPGEKLIGSSLEKSISLLTSAHDFIPAPFSFFPSTGFSRKGWVETSCSSC